MPADAAPVEEYVKENDYTLTVTRSQAKVLESASYPVKTVSSIARTFNFQAQQVTTLTRDYIYQAGDYKYGASAGVSVTTTTQNFNDIQSSGEIASMHRKLVELNGHPPSLEEIIGDGVRNKIKMAAPGGLK